MGVGFGFWRIGFEKLKIRELDADVFDSLTWLGPALWVALPDLPDSPYKEFCLEVEVEEVDNVSKGV